MASEDDKPKKKKGKLKWILLILILLLLGGGSAGVWYYFFSDLPGSRNASEESASQQPQAVKPQVSPNLQTAMLDTFLVNLADPLGKRYIKVTFEVELADPKIAEELMKQKPKIRDSVIMLLSSKTFADLAPPQSKEELKVEVTNRLNLILGGPKVTRVFITDIVIQ